MTDYIFRWTQTYNDCLKRYRNNKLVKSQLSDTYQELAADPFHSPALNTHPVKGAKGKTYTSDVGGRKGKRLIWRLVGDRTIVLLVLGEHDAAFRRAERLNLDYDEATDTIRVFDTAPGDDAPKPYADRRMVEGTLFMAYSDDELATFGFNDREVPALRRLDEESELLELEERLRPEAGQMAMNLFLYGHPKGEQAAAAEREAAELAEAAEAEPTVDEAKEAQLALALLSPRANFELPLVQGALAEVLSQPIEDWMIFLHPDQQTLVERAYSGPARVRGAAGTGKTVVGLHRAAYLARAYDGPILFTTYIRTLPPILEQLFRRLAPDVADRVEFRNIHSWSSQYLRSIKRSLKIDTRRVNASFNSAWSTIATEGSPLVNSGLPKEYFREELDWILQGRGCRQLSDYLGLTRTGRVTPLRRATREQVWALYDEYRHQLRRRKTHDFSALIAEALREVRERGRPNQYTAVIVDEAQDLTEVGIRLLYELAGRDKPDGLLILGDGQQSIYPGGFSLGAVGIDVRGRSSVLKMNYRNTSEILTAAMALVEDHSYDDLGTERYTGSSDVTVLRRGVEPTRHRFDDADSQDVALGLALLDASERTDTDLGDLAVLVPTLALVKHYVKTISGLGLTTQNLEEYKGVSTSAVKVGTYKRAKGLEFKQVFLPNLESVDISDANNDPSQADSRALLRTGLYVALTRARDQVWLSGITPNPNQAWWTTPPPPALP